MGATRWEMIRYSVLPWSRGGITGAVMLGLGRAMGETIAVALVIGSTAQITSHVFLPGDAMAAVIANQFGEAGALHKSALIGLGVVLFVLTILVNVAGPRHRHPPRPPHPGGLSVTDLDLRRSRRARTVATPRSCSRSRPAAAGASATAWPPSWMYGAFVVAVIPLGVHRLLRGAEGPAPGA